MNIYQPGILRFDSLASTNLEAAKRAVAGASEGLCIVASEQTAGRGRLQRQWISPQGAGLYFSILLRPRIDQSAWPLITLMASLAVHDALLEACGLRTDIKWPNDILANNRKLCGILAETTEKTEMSKRAVILGIGINLTSAALPPELHETAASVESATGKEPDLEVVLQALIRALERHYMTLQSARGEEETIRAWSERSSYAQGKRIVVSNGDVILEGTTRGLESDGALRLETSAGEIKIVRAGDVTAVRTRAV
ncbi:MAG: biotin--[acetyl-CoA-carboxylase] ligase [Pyrinomonadaceae bacterium]